MGNGAIRWVSVAALLALALALPSAAHAKRAGTITGKLNGTGAWSSSPAEHIIDVRAIHAETGKTAASKRLTGSLKYKLKVPPGFYMVAAEVVDLGSGEQLDDHSHLVKLKKGKRKRANLRPEPVARRAALAGASGARRPPARTRRRSRSRTTKVLVISPDIRVQGTGLPNGTPIADILITEIDQEKCPPESRTDLVIREHPKTRAWQALLDEIRLHNSGAVDPSTRVRPRFIKPQIEVVGGGQMSNGVVSMQISAVRIRGGDVLATASVSGPEDQFFELIDQLAQQLADKLCKEDETALFDITSASGSYTANQQENESFFGGSCTVESNMQWDTTFDGSGEPFEFSVGRDFDGRPIYGFSSLGRGVPVTHTGDGVSTRSCNNPDPGPNGSTVCDIHRTLPGSLVSLSANPDESNASTTKMEWNYSYAQYSYENADMFGGTCTYSGPRPPPPSHHVSGGLFVSPLNDPETEGYTNPTGITEVPTATFEGDTLTFTFSGGGSFSGSDDDSQGSSAAQWSMTVTFTRR